MDRELPREELKKMRRKKILEITLPVVTVVAVTVCVAIFNSTAINEEDLQLSEVLKGEIETSVNATGKVVPAYEETVVSPVSTKIIEIYCQEGDKVEKGTPLLRLDLQTAEADVRKMADELSMRRYATKQGELSSHTFLTNLEMKIKAKEMSVAELSAEVDNERRLDSLGSGTGDRVRQAELAYSTAMLELEQMRKELVNERESHAVAHKTKKLEEGITAKNLEMLQRTLDDARVKAPHDATVTFLNSSIGTSIGAGEKLAVLADLSKFKITAEIPESESAKVTPGAKAVVRIGKHKLTGKVTQMVPQAIGGIITFTVLLDEENSPTLKAGLRTGVGVVYEVLPDVMMIRNGAYYRGPDEYSMFVLTSGGKLEKRQVTLGESNYEFVEVRSGLKPGDKVAVSDMTDYMKYSSIKVKRK